MPHDKRWLHLYGTQWKKARELFLKAFPLCAECQLIGRVRLAKVVDHIKAHDGDLELFWDRDNWRSLCISCHSRKTAREDGSFGNAKGKGKPKADCKADGIPVDPNHHWNR